jgi:oligopeptide/dipeptide ABC transporter ATP-binding protein
VSLLRIDGLHVEFGPRDAPLVAVHDAGLEVAEGEFVGLIGESGSGKSLTCRSILRLVTPAARVTARELTFDGRDVQAMSGAELRALRAREVGMIFQDPFSTLNPVFRVGDQIAETLRVNLGMKKAAARKEAIELLGHVGIPDPPRRYLAYPHELSGGMRQRVMIAMAMAATPRMLIADEPTTALDVTTQEQILELLLRLRREHDMAVVLVSHDFGVIAQVCDRVAVMYGGYVVESAPVETVYQRPEHPYTRALLESVPAIESAGRRARRQAIEGQPPELSDRIAGCVFRPRCRFARESCGEVSMALEEVASGHASACPVRPFARTPVSLRERT